MVTIGMLGPGSAPAIQQRRRRLANPRRAGRRSPVHSMRRVFDTIIFRLRQQAWLLWARPRTLRWKLLGMHVGPGTILPRIEVTWPHQVSLGARCKLESGVRFKFDGPWRDGPRIVIGDDSWLGADCEFNIHERITIGRHAMIAAGCRFVDSAHGFADRSVPMIRQRGENATITIEEDVWIGAQVVVLKGVTISRGAIIGAGAVVTKSIPAFEIWAGVPAKKIGARPGSPDARSRQG